MSERSKYSTDQECQAHSSGFWYGLGFGVLIGLPGGVLIGHLAMTLAGN